jgi:hypothetical protein
MEPGRFFGQAASQEDFSLTDLCAIDLGKTSIWASCCLFAGGRVQATDLAIFAAVLDAVSGCVEAKHFA